MRPPVPANCVCGNDFDGDNLCMVSACQWEDAAKYRCPRCERASLWTDGTVAAAGDQRDEFWCQNCGTETPLSDCERVA